MRGNIPYYLLVSKICIKRNSTSISISELSVSYILWKNQHREGEILANQNVIELLNNQSVYLQHWPGYVVYNTKWLQMLPAFVILQKQNLRIM